MFQGMFRKRGRPPDPPLQIGGYDKPTHEESEQIPVHQLREAPKQLPLPSVREFEQNMLMQQQSGINNAIVKSSSSQRLQQDVNMLDSQDRRLMLDPEQISFSESYRKIAVANPSAIAVTSASGADVAIDVCLLEAHSIILSEPSVVSTRYIAMPDRLRLPPKRMKHLHRHSVTGSQTLKTNLGKKEVILKVLVPLIDLHKRVRHFTISVGLITICEAIIPKTGEISGLVLVASHISCRIYF